MLALRGDLFKCFPNTSVYVAKAKLKPKAKPSDPDDFELDIAGGIQFPSFKAEVGMDVKLLGFDLSIAEAKGDATKPGWFIIIQETPGETRFGMDINLPDVTRRTLPLTWDDLSWAMFSDINFIDGKIEHKPNFPPQPNKWTSGLPWTPNITSWCASSADMANILYQKPVMIAIHASEMLA